MSVQITTKEAARIVFFPGAAEELGRSAEAEGNIELKGVVKQIKRIRNTVYCAIAAAAIAIIGFLFCQKRPLLITVFMSIISGATPFIVLGRSRLYDIAVDLPQIVNKKKPD